MYQYKMILNFNVKQLKARLKAETQKLFNQNTKLIKKITTY